MSSPTPPPLGGGDSDASADELARLRRRVAELEDREQTLRRALAATSVSDPHESEERFRKLVEELPIGVVSHGPLGEILSANRQARELLGMELGEHHLLTAFDARWNVVREDGEPFLAHERPVATVLGTRKAVRNVVMGVYRVRSGDRVWLLVDAEPELDTDGSVVRVISTLLDLTERKRVEETLLQAQKMEGLGRLAGGIAHDFNNLLAIIGDCTAQAMDELAPESGPAEELRQAQEAVRRAAGLVRQLLAFSRQQTANERVIDPGALVRGLLSMAQRLLGERISIEVNASESLRAVRLDPAQFEQALLNLAVNARDAMPTGGKLTFSIENVDFGPEEARLHPEVRPGPWVRLDVSDTGVGMEPAVQKRLFEPFFTTKAVGRGAGLGLSIVHGVVRQSGGHVWVRSEAGRGTTFSLLLPSAGEPPSMEIAPPMQVTGTILVVDDEPGVRASTARMLSSRGYRVLQACDGRDALDVLEKHGLLPDPALAEAARVADLLVLTDVRMPEMPGPELAQEVRRRAPQMPVVFMSGAPSAKGTEERDPYLLKPFSVDELLAAVRKAMA
ncbi:MAG: response regulator [Deltaproteobacteria bacterium]|nr:response regulator [Deltaproteobacteria bacterium]